MLTSADRDHPLPAERHQLVEAVPRERRAEPDVAEDEDARLDQEPDRTAGRSSRNASAVTFGKGRSHPPKKTVTATQEMMIIAVYSPRKKKANFTPGVLGVEPGDELRLGLRQVERVAVGLGDAGDEVEEEGEQAREDEPEVDPLLPLHDLDERERPRHQQHRRRARGPSGLRRTRAARAERRPPSSEYLLFEAQPPRMIPYTPIDVIARRKSRPMLMSATPEQASRRLREVAQRRARTGSRARAVSAGMTARTGAQEVHGLLGLRRA